MPINPLKAVEYLKKLKELNEVVKTQIKGMALPKNTEITAEAINAMDAIPFAKKPANAILREGLERKKAFFQSPEMIARGGKELNDKRVQIMDEVPTFMYNGDNGKFVYEDTKLQYNPSVRPTEATTTKSSSLKHPIIVLNTNAERPLDSFLHELSHTYFDKINPVNPQILRLTKKGEAKQLTCPIPGYYSRNIEQEEDIHNVLQFMQELGVDINDEKQTSEAYDYLMSLPEDLLTNHLRRTSYYNPEDVKKALHTFKEVVLPVAGLTGAAALTAQK